MSFPRVIAFAVGDVDREVNQAGSSDLVRPKWLTGCYSRAHPGSRREFLEQDSGRGDVSPFVSMVPEHEFRSEEHLLRVLSTQLRLFVGLL